MAENAPRISVIVPMYNVEKYLHLCLTTILNQTFKNFELILVDDCSTDNTLAVAKSFSDSRIKIICNEKNMGKPGPVRNVGLAAAKGKYIYFCDSDDAILPHALRSLYDAAEKRRADVATTLSFYEAIDSEFQDIKGDLQVKPYTVSSFAPVSPDLKTRIYQEFMQFRMFLGPWQHLYNRKFLADNEITFPDVNVEDVFFNFDVVCATSKIAKINVPYYIYRVHNNSASHNPVKISKNIQALSALHEHVEKKLLSLEDPYFVRLVLMFWINQIMSTHVTNQITLEKDTVTKILQEIAPSFGQNSSFILTLLYLYSNSFKENQNLKNALMNYQQAKF